MGIRFLPGCFEVDERDGLKNIQGKVVPLSQKTHLLPAIVAREKSQRFVKHRILTQPVRIVDIKTAAETNPVYSKRF
jgi:hypothetical protein